MRKQTLLKASEAREAFALLRQQMDEEKFPLYPKNGRKGFGGGDSGADQPARFFLE